MNKKSSYPKRDSFTRQKAFTSKSIFPQFQRCRTLSQFWNKILNRGLFILKSSLVLLFQTNHKIKREADDTHSNLRRVITIPCIPKFVAQLISSHPTKLHRGTTGCPKSTRPRIMKKVQYGFFLAGTYTSL